MSRERPVLSSAFRVGLCTLLSRVTGMARDMLLLQHFALAWVSDAFLYAFQFPNLFRRLFGEGALSAVFVPAFTRVLERDGRESAWRLLARTLALLTGALLAITVLLELLVLGVWVLFPSESDPGARTLVLGLTALMIPFMITICVVALLSSLLNCVGSFVPAALTPALLNLIMIGGIVWLGPRLGSDPETRVFGVAISVLIAGVVQLLFLLPVLRRNGVPLGWRFNPGDAAVRGMLRDLGPVTLGQGVLLLGTFLDSQICILLTQLQNGPQTGSFLGLAFRYPLQEGALGAVYVAQRLYQFPLGVAAISLAIAALPALSRLAARSDWQAWSRELQAALRLAAFVGLLSGAMMIVLDQQMVRLLFEYGKFSAADTPRAARVVVCFGVGMWAFCMQHIVLRGFYSIGDVRTPLRISLVAVPLNLTLSLILVWQPAIREAAFGISTSATSALTIFVGLYLLNRRAQHALVDRRLAGAVLKMIIAAAFAAIVAGLLRDVWPWVIDAVHAPRTIGRMIETFGGLLAGSGAFLAAARLMGLPEPTMLLRRRTRGSAENAPPPTIHP